MAATESGGAGGGTPQVRVFAIMRLAHEAVRALLATLVEAAIAGDSGGAKAAWDEFQAQISTAREATAS